MATRKPLVIGSAGLVQQLQSGDTIAGGSDVSQFSQTSASTVAAGSAMHRTGANDTVDSAVADGTANGEVIGMAVAGISSSTSGVIQSDGVVTLTTAEWDVITGGSGGLTAGSNYFLDGGVQARLNTTPSVTAGQQNVLVGKALSTTEMLLTIRDPILL